MVSAATVLVTGAGGFVCSEVAVALARAGHCVLALDRAFDAPTEARLAAAGPGRIERVEGDLDEALGRVAARPDSVIHGAALTTDPAGLGLTRAGHLRRNMELLTTTLDAARAAGAARFLFLSSMGVFAPGDRAAPGEAGRLDEAAAPTAACPYAAAKRAGEIVTRGAAEEGFATLALRLGNVFGPHEAVRETRQTPSLVARMIAEAHATGSVTAATPEARREWAWLPDLAGWIARLATGFGEGTPPLLHAGTPPAISDLELARAVAARLPGTDVCAAPPPHAATRPPMGTLHAEVLPQADWTPIPDALDRLVARVPA
jgi:nucleoside-diphosphate-sugar epimerase